MGTKQLKLYRCGARRLRSAGCPSGAYYSPSPFGQTSRHSGKPPGRPSQPNFPALAPPANEPESVRRPRSRRPVRRTYVRRGFFCCPAANRSPRACSPAALRFVRGLSIGGLNRFSRVTRSHNYQLSVGALPRPVSAAGKPANSSARRPFAPRPTPGRVPRPPRYRAAR